MLIFAVVIIVTFPYFFLKIFLVIFCARSNFAMVHKDGKDFH